MNNLDIGKQIVHHELAHSLEEIFLRDLSKESKQKFDRLRSCINKLHRYAVKDKVTGLTSFLKEDYADYISAYINQGDAKLMTCAGLEHDVNKYKGLSLELFSPDGGHTADPIRVIIEAVNKKISIPQSCKELIDSNSSYYDFNRCDF